MKDNTIESIRSDCSVNGWNGYSALPISETVLSNAELLQGLLLERFQLFPTGRNSVQFECECLDIGNMKSVYFELEVFESKIVYSVITTYKVLETDLWTSQTDESQIKFESADKCAKWLCSGMRFSMCLYDHKTISRTDRSRKNGKSDGD